MISQIILSPQALPQLQSQLRAGQALQLTVVEAALDGAVVSLGGYLFRAEGKGLPTKPGEGLVVLVERVTPQEICVRPCEYGVRPEQTSVTDGLVRSMALPPGADTAAVVKELLRWRLPVDRETVLLLLTALQGVPRHERGAWLSARVWLESLDWEYAGQVRAALDYILGRTTAGPEGHEYLNRAHTPPGQDAVQVLSLNGGDRFTGEVYLSIAQDDRHRVFASSDEKPQRVVIHLDTRVLGELWCRLDLNGPSLSVLVCAPDGRLAVLAKDAGQSLQDLLTRAGFEVRSLRIEERVVGQPGELLFGAAEAQLENVYRPLDALV